MAGLSTGSALTTRRNGCNRPPWSVSSARARRNPSTSWPANRTLTRQPGTASAAIAAGTE